MRFPILALVLLGCASGAQALTPIPAEWRKHATPSDVQRIDQLDASWRRALDAARADGHAAELRDGGSLFKPGTRLNNALPPAGLYACSMTKLGGSYLTYVAYPAFRCRITAEGGQRHFVKLTGSQRQIGKLYPAGPRRGVFIGTIMLGNDVQAVPYGRDPDRDQVAVVERIGPQRWRMAFPVPRFESNLDVLELVPVRR